MRKLKKIVPIGFAIVCALIFCDRTDAQTPSADWRVVLIRHAEKPKKGDNLTCQGLNRAMQLPALLHTRFGVPSATYIPAMALGDSTKHCRMFQTVIPFAVKYNLTLTSRFVENDSTGIAQDILQKKGTVLVVWEHKKLVSIVRALGIKDEGLHWPDDDYDSIWIVRFRDGKAVLTKSREGLKPSTACRF
jgi:hypothetical protein